MTICIELKIPLFLVGKPGSSKSLAKTVVSDVMQGEQSYSDLYKGLREIQMISFQCSPIATAGGILGTFRWGQFWVFISKEDFILWFLIFATIFNLCLQTMSKVPKGSRPEILCLGGGTGWSWSCWRQWQNAPQNLASFTWRWVHWRWRLWALQKGNIGLI